MYLNPRKHVLSNVLLTVALIRFAGVGLSFVTRFYIRRNSGLPDMANTTLWKTQTLFSLATILLSSIPFFFALNRIRKDISRVPEEERFRIAALQRETFGDKNANLDAESIRKLLEIWVVILCGVQLMYEAFSLIYRHFILRLSDLLSSEANAASAYASMYNLSHSFKYQGMLIALLLGVFMTAIHLNDRFLKLCAVFAGAVFLLSSTILEMDTFFVFGNAVGIVWSSVIYHLIDTFGLIAVAVYLRFKYKGV